jgi:pimeloyl-ACP methyl ester carboxylesterase
MPIAHGLHYFASHAEETLRPPALLIHGAGGQHLYWPPEVRRLPRRRILALDLPGHGRSSGRGHQTIEGYVDAVAEFLRSAGLCTVALIGHSMGGAIALQMAYRFPERVLGLCLIATGARLRVARDILQATADPGRFGEAVSLIVEMAFSPRADARLTELAAERMRETRPSVLHADFLACDAFDATAWLGRIASPTTIICGEDDRMTPVWCSEFLRGQIRGAQLEIVPGAGHMVMLEQPGSVAAHIDRFLNGLVYHPGA